MYQGALSLRYIHAAFECHIRTRRPQKPPSNKFWRFLNKTDRLLSTYQRKTDKFGQKMAIPENWPILEKNGWRIRIQRVQIHKYSWSPKRFAKNGFLANESYGRGLD